MTNPAARLTFACECGREIVLTGYAAPLSAEEDRLRRRAVAIVDESPDELTRTQLASRMGIRKRDAVAVVSRLIADGVLGPDKPKAALTVLQPLSAHGEAVCGQTEGAEVA